MSIQAVNDKAAWNDFLLTQPSQAGIFLQTWEWGEFQKAVGRKVYRFVHSSQPTAYSFAQVIELPLPFGKKYWFIPRGPVVGARGQGLGTRELMHKIERAAKQEQVIFLRWEPLFDIQELTPSPYSIIPTRPIQPSQTIIMDITKSEDELLAGMHEKTRYNIRLALRRGLVRSSQFTVHSFEEFWKLLQETAKRDKFRTHPREYYEKMLEVLHNPSQPPLTLRGGDDSIPPLKVRGGTGGVMSAQLHIAYSGITPVVAAIVGYFGDTATYLHGASSYEHRALMGPYALHWEIMRDAKRAGYKYYDFWGVNVAKSKEQRAKSTLSSKLLALRCPQSWQGMTRFKMGFGGTVVNYPGTFDLPLSWFGYAGYRLARFVRQLQ